MLEADDKKIVTLHFFLPLETPVAAQEALLLPGL